MDIRGHGSQHLTKSHKKKVQVKVNQATISKASAVMRLMLLHLVINEVVVIVVIRFHFLSKWKKSVCHTGGQNVVIADCYKAAMLL